MVLIFGGAYQGKLEYAMKEFNIGEEQVFTCTSDNLLAEVGPEFAIVDKIENWAWELTKAGKRPVEEIDLEALKDKIIIARDNSQGIVPLDEDERQFREDMGRLLMAVSKNSDKVIRVFCGLGEVIK
ncbi:MAG: bifunctional adenosylcobinamide kinase/adenosylcobinamide-phosphate guanylyltransferase [Clostridia bacterium]|nr:bifunctional adenosylcobinamide kinase/adenosylcobinamide-phosphate guanylyltransferase [Clostridia bacterium]